MNANYLLTVFSAAVIFHIAISEKQRLILVSLDGFRWDFRNKTHTPHLDRLVKDGSTVEYVLNVFPTSTIPNHQSIVTGLYPENHEMINNIMFNRSDGTKFDYTQNNDPKWWGKALPVWVTNQEQGHVSAVIGWPGGAVPYNGKLPKHLMTDGVVNGTESILKWERYGNKSLTKWQQNSTESLIKWLKSDTDLNFAAIYFPEPDEVSHEHGPDSTTSKGSEAVRDAIQDADDFVGNLLKRLEDEQLLESTNIIVMGKCIFLLGEP